MTNTSKQIRRSGTTDKFQLRDKERASRLASLIESHMPERPIKIVHVCGTHEMAITEHGLRSLFPEGLQVLEGPGCPVCVTPTKDLDTALQLAQAGCKLAVFGDMMRVPGTNMSFEQARSKGADVRVVYSVQDAVDLARSEESEVVFFGVGFETTAPTTASVIQSDPPPNFSVLTSHKLIPPAMEELLTLPDHGIDGFLAPGHVSTIIGLEPYQNMVKKNVPTVVAGFEPLDILYAVDRLLEQINSSSPAVENAYRRAVSSDGNQRSLDLVKETFAVDDAMWRGIGSIADSGLYLREKYQQWDARRKFDLEGQPQEDRLPECLCPSVITAQATPDQCELFGEQCTPRHPYGPCMVGSEAMCNIWYRYGGRPKL